MVASKFTEDFYFSNTHFARVGGISEEIMNELERELLSALDYQLFVTTDEIATYVDKMDTYFDMMKYEQDRDDPTTEEKLKP